MNYNLLSIFNLWKMHKSNKNLSENLLQSLTVALLFLVATIRVSTWKNVLMELWQSGISKLTVSEGQAQGLAEGKSHIKGSKQLLCPKMYSLTKILNWRCRRHSSPTTTHHMPSSKWLPVAEVEKGGENGSIAPRRKWTNSFLAEGFRPIQLHMLQFFKRAIYCTFTVGPMKNIFFSFVIY